VRSRVVGGDGETVVGVDVDIPELEFFCFFADFFSERGVVRDLEESGVGHFERARENGGGFAGPGTRIDNDIFPRFDMLDNDVLFFAGF